jgi:chaperonin GroEL
MQPSRLATNTRLAITGDEAQSSIKEGVRLAFELAKAAYGPRSGNVSIEAQYGDPISSHDGIFNLDHLHLEDPKLDMPARTLIQASRQTNVHVGDGTTAAVILASAFYNEARELLASTSLSRMDIARRLQNAAGQVLDYIDTIKIPATEELLKQVAIISASDEAVGKLINETVQAVGADGGVLIEQFSGAGIYNEITNGFYYRKGFSEYSPLTDINGLESRFDSVPIFVCEKPLTTLGDIEPILDQIVGAKLKQLVIIGQVEQEAMGALVKLAYPNTVLLTTVVDSPDFGALRTLFMDDVALYTGAKVFSPGADVNDFDISMLGEAKVVVTEHATTLLNGDGESNEDLSVRVQNLRDELSVAVSPQHQEAVRNRLSRLAGQIAILRVGGNTDVEREEVKLRVEDAVAALQAAIKDGVVPGGGVTLARIPSLIPFRKAFEVPLRTLLDNAGRNTEYGLWHVREAKDWQGYDLRDETVRLVNLKKAGVVDPTLVIKEVVSNAASVAADLIKTTVLMPFSNREAKRG